MRRRLLLAVGLVSLLWVSLAGAQQCTQAQLNTEFTTDPTVRTYTTCTQGNDQCVLDKFNAPCADVNCKIDQVITRAQLYIAIDANEVKALANSTAPADVARINLLQIAMANDTFDMSKSAVRQKLNDVFTGAGSPISNAAIGALQQKNVPRSQIVCGRPATLCDVSLGLRGDKC